MGAEQIISDTDDELLTKRSKLTVYNNTNEDFEGGVTFRLIWTGDVDTGHKETQRLEPGQNDWFKSKGIGNGGNVRNFEIELRMYNRDNSADLLVGNFNIPVINDIGSDGRSAETHLHLNTTTLFITYTFTTPQGDTGTFEVGPMPSR